MKSCLHLRLRGRAKCVLVAFLILLNTALFAQIERGRYVVGGSGDLSLAYTGTTSNFNFSISPSFGVFVVRGFAIGLRYSIGIGSVRSYDTKNLVYTSTTTFTTQIGPTLRYYYGKKQLKGVASFNANYLVFTSIHKSSVTNFNGFTVGGSLGAAYFFNPNLSIETALYLTAAGYEKQLPTSRVGFSVGLFAFLDKKKQE